MGGINRYGPSIPIARGMPVAADSTRPYSSRRKRIAEDLHDDLGATLSTLSLHLSNSKNDVADTVLMQRHYSNMLMLSNKAVNDMRNIAHNLLPKDFTDIGLFKTLEKRIAELNCISNVRFLLITEGDEKKLGQTMLVTIYRISDELLTNIIKHAAASEATLQLLVEVQNVQLMSEDNGIGFATHTAKKGIGLKNIAGRVDFLKGRIHIDSSKGGTQTIINIPL